MPESSTRLGSLHDPDARPIRKGRLGKRAEFGDEAQIVDNVDRVIHDHTTTTRPHQTLPTHPSSPQR